MKRENLKFGYFLVTSLLLINTSRCSPECGINIEGNSASQLQKTSCVIRSGAEKCTDAALEKQYPDLFNQQRFPAKPKDMTILPYEKIYIPNNKHSPTLKYYPGGTIVMWPTVDSSMQDIKGFFVYIHGPVKDSCVLLTFNGTIAQDHNQAGLNFSIKLWPLSTSQSYTFKSYSLPKPKNNIVDDLFQIAYLNTSSSWEAGRGAADWSTMIMYRNISRRHSLEAHVSFSEAPADLGIEKYQVKLFRILSGNNISDETREKVDEVLISKTSHVFTDIKDDGVYRVQIIPDGSNQCTLNMCYNTKSCESCLATNTPRFLLYHEGNALPTVPTGPASSPESSTGDDDMVTTAVKTSSQTQTRTGGGKMSVSVQIIISVIVIALVLVIAGVLIFFMRSHCQGEDCVEVLNKTRKLHTAALGHTTYPVMNNQRDIEAVPERKCVFLLHAKDNEYHSRVVEKFAIYLVKRCNCEVLYLPWCTTDKFKSIVTALERADVTIIVSSESAFLQYQNWKHPNESPSSDMIDDFMPAFRQICTQLTNNPQFSEKLLSVKFDYTQEEHLLSDICFNGQYRLLQQLPDLILRINKHACVKSSLGSTTEGKALKYAVRSAEKYMQEIVNSKHKQKKNSVSSHSKTNFDKGLDYVREKYLEKNCQDKKEHIKVGVFTIDPEECSLFNGHDPSICPAITLLECNLEEPKPQVFGNHQQTNSPKIQYQIHGSCQQTQNPILGSYQQTNLPKTKYPNHGPYQQTNLPRIPPNQQGGSCPGCANSTCNDQFVYPPYPAVNHGNPYSNRGVEYVTKTYWNNHDRANQVSEDSTSLGFVGSDELFRSEDSNTSIVRHRHELFLSSGYDGSAQLQESVPEDHEFFAPEFSDTEDICSRVLEMQMREVNQRYDEHLARENSDSLNDSSYEAIPLNFGIDKVGLNIECRGLPNGEEFYAPCDDSSIEDNAEVTSLGGYSI